MSGCVSPFENHCIVSASLYLVLFRCSLLSSTAYVHLCILSRLRAALMYFVFHNGAGHIHIDPHRSDLHAVQSRANELRAGLPVGTSH